MDDPQDIHQIEYRWQPKTDMTAVASSLADAWSWTQRIGPWVRHPSVEVPTESVRYEIFDDSDDAVIAWRQRDPQAAMLSAGPAGRPLVSRVLLGSAELLTPELAMAFAMGFPLDLLGPPPGTVAPGGTLPVIRGDELTGMINDRLDNLDAAAAQQVGLELLVAAALDDPDTPLSVELPERYISQSLLNCPQGRLLWGLRRTLSPLLGRDWSFSTFEPPLDDVDPETLPAIVFRLTQAAGQQGMPRAFRRELRLRPYEPVTQPARSRRPALAKLLVAAYAEHGGAGLSRMLIAWTAKCNRTDDCIEVAYEKLSGLVPRADPVEASTPVTLVTRQVQSPPPPPPPAASVPVAVPEEAGAPTVDPDVRERPVLSMPGSSADAEQTVAVAAFSAGPPPPVSSAPPPPAITVRPETQRGPQPVRLSHVVTVLGSGPASSGFGRALDALRAGNIQSEPSDRAYSRKLLRDNGWYVEALGRHPQVHWDDILVMIFMHAVVPDLAQPHVDRELANWVSRGAAPPRVVKALCAASDGTARQSQMVQILLPVLGWRWLLDNKISMPGPMPSAAEPADRDPVGSPGKPAPPLEDAPPMSHGPKHADPHAPGAASVPFLLEVAGILQRRLPLYVTVLVAIGLVIIVQLAL